jgi:hypothetical protein
VQLEFSSRISTTCEIGDEFGVVLVRECCVCSEFASLGNWVPSSGLRIVDNLGTDEGWANEGKRALASRSNMRLWVPRPNADRTPAVFVARRAKIKLIFDPRVN